MSYMNTHTVLMLMKTPGKYSIKYYVDTKPPPDKTENENIYSQVITIGCGFGLMFLAACFFEGRNLCNAIKKWMVNLRGNSSADGIAVEVVDGTEEDDMNNEGDSEGNIAMGGRVAERSFGPAIIESENVGFEN